MPAIASRLKPTQILVGVVVGAVLAGGVAFAESSGVHGCVNNKSRVFSVRAKCPKGNSALTLGAQGPKGARGAKGATGAVGPQGQAGPEGQAGPQGEPGTNATSSGPTAKGQVWMGSSAAELAPGNSQNIVGVGSAGVGGAVVDVQGCSSAGLVEPVIEVTAGKDPSDTLAGANNTANVAEAYVSGWSTEPDTSILVVDVDTTSPVNGVAVDSDFSITVFC